jgi:hypothetical protein
LCVQAPHCIKYVTPHTCRRLIGKMGFLGSSSRWVGVCLLLHMNSFKEFWIIAFSQTFCILNLYLGDAHTVLWSYSKQFIKSTYFDRAQSGWVQVGMPTDHSIRNGWLENSIYIYIYVSFLTLFLLNHTLPALPSLTKFCHFGAEKKTQFDSLTQRLFVKKLVRFGGKKFWNCHI